MTVSGLVARAAPARTPSPSSATAAEAEHNRSNKNNAADAERSALATGEGANGRKSKREMRPLMTRALTDAMEADERRVYIGEDVEHGGYYRVSEGLRERFGRRRIFDWPPDEASLIGAGRGTLRVRVRST